MNKILIILIIILIIINIVLFIYGKAKVKAIKKNEKASDEDYKSGMKYMIISSLISFLTIILITVAALLKVLHK